MTPMSTRLVHLFEVLSLCGEGMHPLILYSPYTRHQVHKAPTKPLLKPSSPQVSVQTHPGYNQVKIPSSLPSVSVYPLQLICTSVPVSTAHRGEDEQEEIDVLLKLLCVFSPVFLFFLVHFLSLCPLLIKVSHRLIWSRLPRLNNQHLSREKGDGDIQQKHFRTFHLRIHHPQKTYLGSCVPIPQLLPSLIPPPF